MNPLIIGIAGGTGSGKTSVTNRVIESLDMSRVLVIQHDSYYKDIGVYPDPNPALINFDHPDSLETPLLIDHLRALRRREKVRQPLYDFATHRRTSEWRELAPCDVIIVEGILIFVDSQLRDLMDIKIFVDTDADERLIHRLRRDIVERGRSLDSVLQQYTGTVKPMHLEFVEPSKHWADIIIPRGAENRVAVDMVVTKILAMLSVKGRGGDVTSVR